MTDVTVLAAIDDSSAAAPVLVTAAAMADLFGARVAAMHVGEGAKQTAEAVAVRQRTPLRVVPGDPIEEIVAAASTSDVALLVVGARGQPSGPRPTGHVALAVVERVDVPVVVVPPDVDAANGGPEIRRVLVPMEGTRVEADAMAGLLRRLGGAGVEVVGTHVFDARTTPSSWDEQLHAEQSWADAFLTRWCEEPSAVDLHLRRGVVTDAILEEVVQQHADLVALCWSRDMSEGHAAVIRGTLTHATVPVMLVPVGDVDRPDDSGPT